MKHFLLIILILCFCACRTTRQVQTTVADTVHKADATTTASSAIDAHDSTLAVSAAFVSDSIHYEETVVAETFDSTGTLRQRTTTQRRLVHNHAAGRVDSVAATSTFHATDTVTATTSTHTAQHFTSTTEKEAEAPTHRKLCFILFLLLAAAVWLNYKRLTK